MARRRMLQVLLPLLVLPLAVSVGYFALGRTLREPVGAAASVEHPSLKRSTCLDCHGPIAAEWRRSFHFRSLTGPFWQRIRKKGFDDVFSALRVPCVNCHAPANVLDLAEGSHPTARTSDRALGVDCVSCHLSVDGIRGPGRSKSAPHEVIGDERFRDPFLASTAICARCHDENLDHAKTVATWRGSEQARQGTTCLHCHMPLVTAANVEGEPVRERRSHRFPGDKVPALLRSGLNASLRIRDGHQAVVRVTNDRIGHSFPAAGTNSLIVRLTVLDTEERPVRKVRREFGTREWIPGYLDFWPFLRVSKIPVGESRQVSVDLPPGHGTVSAEFGYRDWFAIEDRDLIFQRLTRRF